MSFVDLHVHSTASDGESAPGDVVRLAATAGLEAIALTDHDTLGGMPEAEDAGHKHGVRIVAGCEFSVRAPWGEMHLLGYFLPPDDDDLLEFLQLQRDRRASRAARIVERLQGQGVTVDLAQVRIHAGGTIGRPHVARALVASGAVRDITEAFQRYLGRGRPAFVPKDLPTTEEVSSMVQAVGGVTSAAHLKGRATAGNLRKLKKSGVDAVEARHPSHEPEVAERIEKIAGDCGLAVSGGSDWHGDSRLTPTRGSLGSQQVPARWLEELEERRTPSRAPRVAT